MATVIPIRPAPDQHASVIDALEEAKAAGLRQVAIIGWTQDGTGYRNGNIEDGRDLLWLIETLKRDLLE